MFYYHIIEVSEGIEANKTRTSTDCDICHYWYSLNKGFRFQLNVSNRCHDLLIMSMNLSNIAILKIKNAECIISGISKNESINLMQNADLIEKSGTL